MQNKYLLSCVEISKIFVNINLLKCSVWIKPMAYIAPVFLCIKQTHPTITIPNARSVSFEILYQGRSQTSEQDEASFERQRREPLTGGLGTCRPRKFEILRFRNALLRIFRGIFLQKSQSLNCFVLPHAGQFTLSTQSIKPNYLANKII